jgi:hypothetical protein
LHALTQLFSIFSILYFRYNILLPSVKLLDDIYRTEKNVDVREKLLLVRRVLVDNEHAARVAENEFHRSRWWAYKWLKRYAKSGLEGLKNLLDITKDQFRKDS